MPSIPPLTQRSSALLLVIASLLASSLAGQETVFESDFSAAVVNPATYPEVTLSSTGWVVGATKNHGLGVVEANGLSLDLSSTSAAFVEAAAIFTPFPVELSEAGDFIEATLIFTADAGILQGASNSQLGFGLFDSGGVPPPEGVSGQILFGGDSHLSGGIEDWIGYPAVIGAEGSSNDVHLRPAQVPAAISSAQELFFPGNTGGFLASVDLTSSAGAGVVLEDGSVYTLVYRLDLAAPGSDLQVSLKLYSGTGTGGLLLSAVEGAATGASLATTTFDAVGLGYIRKGYSGNSSITYSSLKIVSNQANLPPVIQAGPSDLSITLGGAGSLQVNVTGTEPLTYTWTKDGSPLDPPNNAGTLAFSGADASIEGLYQVNVSNAFGEALSTTATVSVTDSLIAPSIQNEPQGIAVLAGESHTFTVFANGSSPLTYEWFKDGSDVRLENGPTGAGSVLAGAQSASLTLSGATLADAGSYRAVVSNAVGSADSAVATLVVNLAPALLSQPEGAIVSPGESLILSVASAAAFPVPDFQWERSSDAVAWTAVEGANTATLELTGALETSGFYRVVVSNEIQTLTSDPTYFGIPSTQPVSFAPASGAVNLSIDQQLRITFPEAPKLSMQGLVTIHDAANDTVVASIDTAQFQTYQLWEATIPNSSTHTVQGRGYHYLPLTVYGNEVWITLGNSQRLAYGKTYYVKMDAGVLLDSNNASYPGISDAATWRFSTRASGPDAATPTSGPVVITVGMDGAGDFATVQGASDWIPENNQLPRTILIEPGIYRDMVVFDNHRDHVTLQGNGPNREAVQLIYRYPNFAPAGFGPGSVFAEDTDFLTIRDLTIDNEVYVPQPSSAGSFAPGAPGFAGPIVSLHMRNCDQTVLDNVLLKGGQDTLYDGCDGNGTASYYYGCEIWGSVDFIYGDCLSVFDRCEIVEIRPQGGPVSAPRTPAEQPYGAVFLNCRFPQALVANGYPYDVQNGSTTFMRPWRQDGHTAVINSELGPQMSTKGWLEWSAPEGQKEVTARAREFGSTLIGGGAAPTPAQRRAAGAYWLNTYDPDYNPAAGDQPKDVDLAPATGRDNRIEVIVDPDDDLEQDAPNHVLDPEDYTVEAIFGHSYFNLGGWLPSVPARALEGPAAQVVELGQTATFTVTGYGYPAPSFQWQKDGVEIPGATSATLTLASTEESDAGVYAVAVSNDGGSAMSAGAPLVFRGPESAYLSSFDLDPATDGLFSANPDGDALSNRWEFFLGTDPTEADALDQYPMGQVSNEGADLVLEFNRWAEASIIDFAVEYSTSLEGDDWTTAEHGVDGVKIEVTPAGDFDTIRITLPSGGTRIFGRLRL